MCALNTTLSWGNTDTCSGISSYLPITRPSAQCTSGARRGDMNCSSPNGASLTKRLTARHPATPLSLFEWDIAVESVLNSMRSKRIEWLQGIAVGSAAVWGLLLLAAAVLKQFDATSDPNAKAQGPGILPFVTFPALVVLVNALLLKYKYRHISRVAFCSGATLLLEAFLLLFSWGIPLMPLALGLFALSYLTHDGTTAIGNSKARRYR